MSNYKLPEVYKMFSGTYALTNTDTERSADEISADVSSILTTLEGKVIDKGYFSLNPANNPTFTVSGRESLKKDGSDFTNTENYISNGSSVVIEVATGLDSIPLSGDTLKVYVLPCDANGNATSSTRIYPETTKSKSGTSYKFVTVISSSAGMEIGSNYIFGVEGTDQNGNDVLVEGNGYGFHLSSSGAAPTLNVTSPSETITYLGKGSAQVFSGTVVVEEGLPSISILKGEEVVWTKTFAAGEAVKISSGKQYSFSYTIPAGDGGFSQSESSQNSFTIKASQDAQNTILNKTVMYDVDGPSIDIQSVSPYAYKYTDESGTTETNASGENVQYLNGTITAKFSIADDFDIVDVSSKAPVYEFYLCDKADISDSAQKITLTPSTINPIKQEIADINTASWNYTGPVTLKVTAYDRAGNKTEEYAEYKVDQDTDYPVILPNSATSVTFTYTDFTIEEGKVKTNAQLAIENSGKSSFALGGQLLVKLIDDDGVKSVKVTREKIGGEKVEESPVEYTNLPTEIVYTYSLPSSAEAPGIYKFTIEAEDMYGTTSTVGPFGVRITSSAPNLSSVTSEVSYATNNTTDIASKAVKKFKNKIEISSANGPFYIFRKESAFSESDFDLTKPTDLVAGQPTSKSADVIFVKETELTTDYDEFEPTTTNSSIIYYYKVYDKEWTASNIKQVTCKVDDGKPETPVISSPAAATTYINGSNYVFTVNSVKDNESSIKGIYYAIVKANEDGSFTDPTDTEYKWFEYSSSTWNLNVELKSGSGTNDDSTLYEGKDKLYIRTQDVAGNLSTVASKEFYVDLSLPVITVTDEENTSLKAKNYYNDSFKFKVNATDTNPFGNVTVAATVDGTEITPSEGTYTVSIGSSKENTDLSLVITATDAAGRTNSETYTVHKDTKGPVIEAINSPASEEIINNESKYISGTVSDGTGSGVSKVYYQINASETALTLTDDLTGWKEATAAGESWNSTAALTTEGTNYLHVIAVDAEGNKGTDKVQKFMFDKANPNITVGTVTSPTKADITISGKAWDSDKVASVVIKENSKIYKTITSGFTVSDEEPSENNWSATLTVTGDSPDVANGSHTFTIIATDIAGKTAERNVTVVADTKAPTVSITNQNGTTVPVTVTQTESAAFDVKGTASDENGDLSVSNVNSVEIVFIDAPSTESDTAIKAAAEAVPAERIYSAVYTAGSWTYTVAPSSLTTEFASEGKKYICVKAIDNVGNESAWAYSSFIFDKAKPTSSIDSYTQNGGSASEVSENDTTVTAGKQFTLSGTAKDSYGVAKVEIWEAKNDADFETAATYTFVPEESSATLGTSYSWNQADLPTIASGENLETGKYKYKVQVTDIAGKVSTESLVTVLIDITPPAIEITSPEADTILSGTSTVLGGTVQDVGTSGVSAYYYAITNSSTAPALSTSSSNWTKVLSSTSGTTTANWELSKLLGTGKTAASNTIYEGNWYIHVFAEDKAGNISSEAVTKHFYVDQAAPSVSSVKQTNQSGESLKENEDFYYNSDNTSFVISGKILESNGLTGFTATSDNGTTVELSAAPAASTTAQEWTCTVSGITADKEIAVTITATDIANRSVTKVYQLYNDTKDPNIEITNPADDVSGLDSLTGTIDTADNKRKYTFRGTVNDDGSGITDNTYKYKFTKTAFTTDAAAIADAANWEDYTKQAFSTVQEIVSGTGDYESGKLKEGEWYLYIYAKDKVGHYKLEKRNFWVDITNPAVTTVLNDGTSDGTAQTSSDSSSTTVSAPGFTLKYKAEDTHGIDSISVKVLKNGTELTKDTNYTIGEKSGDYYPITLVTPADDTYTFEITAKDLAGKTTTVTRMVRLDTTGPVLETTSPDFEQWQTSKNVTVLGTASDVSGISKIYYALDKTVSLPAAADAKTTAKWTAKNWKELAGSSNWTISLSEVTDNAAHKLSLSAVDKCGNMTEITTKTLKVDATAPVITETGLGTSDIKINISNYESGVNPKGTYTEAVSGIASITIKDSENDASLWTAATNGDGTGKEWTLSSVIAVANEDNKLADGTHVLTITATDKAGNSRTVQRTVVVDTQKPVQTSLAYTNTKTSSGAWNYTNKTADYTDGDKNWYNQSSFGIKVTGAEDKEHYSTGDESGLTSVQYTTDGSSWISMTSGSDGYTATANCSGQGSNTIKTVAEDKVGNQSAELSQTVYIDTLSPDTASVVKIGTSTSNLDQTQLVNGEADMDVYIYTEDSGATSGTASGIRSVVLSKIGSKEASKSTYEQVTWAWYNAASLKTVYTTTAAPTTSSKVYTDNLGTAGETAISAVTDGYTSITAGSTEYIPIPAGVWKVTIDTEDFATGIVNFAITDNVRNKAYTYSTFQMDFDNQYPSATISSITDADSSTAYVDVNSSFTISGSAKDNKTLSSVKLQYTTATYDTTNKTYTDGTTWKDFPAADGSFNDMSNWSVNVDTKNAVLTGTTTKIFTNEKYYAFRAVATDSAGNTGNSYVTKTGTAGEEYSSGNVVHVYVNQDTDRPTVKVSNLVKSESNYILKYGTNSQIQGTVTDDDSTSTAAVKYLIIGSVPVTSYDGTDVTCTVSNTSKTMTKSDFEAAYGKTTFTTATGDWTYEPKDASDGQKSFYIYVKDNNGQEYYTTSSSQLTRPYWQFKTDTKTDNSAAIAYNSDSNSPSVSLAKGKAYKTSTEAVTGADFEGLSASYIIGGSEKGYIQLQITANDANGIAGMTMEVTGTKNSEDVVLYSLATDSSYTGFTASGSVIAATDDETTTENESKTTKIWTTDVIDLTSAALTGDKAISSENITVKITPYDNSGLIGNGTFNFVLDNAGPSIRVTSPASGSEVTGTISVSGTAVDSGSAGTSEIYWLVPTAAQVTAAGDAKAAGNATDVLSYYKGLTWNGGHTHLDSDATVTSWKFNFDGTDNVTFDTYDSTTYATPSDGIYTLPVWFMAVDNVGNTTVFDTFSINHNPDGDKAKTLFTYPTESDYDSDKYITLGGTMRITGSAEIPSGTTTVKSVYLQIADAENASSASFDSTAKTKAGKAVAINYYNKDGTKITEATYSSSNGDYYKNDGGYGLTVVSAYDVINEILGLSGDKAVSSSTTMNDETIKGYGFDSRDALNAWWGIKANGTSSWNIALNGNDGMNPSSKEDAGTNNICLRACGVNANGKFGAWTTGSNIISIHVDDSSPTISSVINQYSGLTKDTVVTGTTAAEASYTASQAYESDMYLKGSWYLVATVLDESGINTLTVKKGATTLTENDYYIATVNETSTTTAVNGTTLANISDSTTDKNGYKIYIPISQDSSSVSYTVTATDSDGTSHTTTQIFNFNVDNIAPSLESLKGNGNTLSDSTAIQNSNYIYEVSGSSMDAGSGFERTVFYFMRKSGTTKTTIGTQVVMDPLITTGTSDCKVTMAASLDNASATAAGPLEIKQGDTSYYLYATKHTGSATTNTFTSNSFGSHVRQDGLIYIDGVLRKITSATSTVISFEPALSAASSSITAYFPVAAVIDNTGSETVNSTTAKPMTFKSGDDGDKMPESITKAGTTWSWSGTIQSDNMPDGPVSLVILAFDKAGNVNGTTINTTITNNAPRVAKLYLATDLNSNNTFETNEFETYNLLGKEGSAQKAYALNFSTFGTDYGAGVFTAKDKLAVVPEIVGGNGTMNMVALKGATATTAVTKDASYYKCDTCNQLFTTNVTSHNKADGETSCSGTLSAISPVTLTSIANKTATATTATALTATDTTDYTISADGFAAAAAGNNFYAYVLTNAQLAGIDAFDTNATTTTGRTTNAAADGESKPFSFTFWDSTEETTCGTDSQNAVISVADFTLDLTDGTAPTTVINPFYWNSSSSNSLYDNSTSNGHIELEGDLPSASFTSSGSGVYDLDPKVSGQIVFTGTAYDEHGLESIDFTLTGTGITTISGNIATYSSGSWTVSTSTISDGYAATVSIASTNGNWSDTAYYDQNGHKVYWTLSIDTSKISTVAAKDVSLSVLATDMAGNITSATTTSALNSDKTARIAVTDGTTSVTTYQMDVVPYITQVETSLSSIKDTNPSVYDRTALGHYPVWVHQDSPTSTSESYTTSSETVKVYGFNLAGGTAYDASSNTGTMTSGTRASGSSTFSGTYYSVPVTNFTSGKIRVTLSYKDSSNNTISVSSLNNENSNSAEYNKKSNGDNNTNLTDDVVFDVWQLNSKAAIPLETGADITSVSMTVNQNKKFLNFAFANGSLDNSFGTSSYSYTHWGHNYDDYAYTTIVANSSGKTFGTIVGQDTNASNTWSDKEVDVTNHSYSNRAQTDKENGTGGTPAGTCSNFNYISEALGVTSGSLNYTEYEYQGYNAKRLEKLGFWRYANSSATAWTQVVKKGRIPNASIGLGYNSVPYIAYVDIINSQIRFRHSTQITSGDIGHNSMVESDSNNWSVVAGYAESMADSASRTLVNSYHAGDYVALDVIPGTSSNTSDVVVLVWFDSTANKLMYTYKVNPRNDYDMAKDGKYGSGSSTNAGYWSSPKEIFSGAGYYCKIKADSDGGIHIAAYDYSAADVKYAYLSKYDSTDDVTSVTVDATDILGTHLTLDVAKVGTLQVPYIGYYANSIQLPKVAYLTTSGTNTSQGVSTNAYTGNWEVSVVPTRSSMLEGDINVGVWKSSGSLTTSYSSGTTVGKSYASASNGKCYGNGTSNSILAYAIMDDSGAGGYIETAQMK